MKEKRFQEILCGPLRHPHGRSMLAMALRFVVDETGKAGEEALEAWAKVQADYLDVYAPRKVKQAPGFKPGEIQGDRTK